MAAGVFLPITGERREPAHGRLLGSRHRAALGLALVTDAAVFVVSEETGTMSVGLDGILHELRAADAPGRPGVPTRRWSGRLARWLRLQAS
jgi:DNA integrity scanning protein DisA with diadenylate cyclase activity